MKGSVSKRYNKNQHKLTVKIQIKNNQHKLAMNKKLKTINTN